MSLALEWCRRQQHYFNLWVAQADPQMEYSDVVVASYRPSPEWEQFCSGLEGVVLERAQALAK
eukprot:7068573-Lingulodinium_polyedra.AAC.1